MSRASTIFAPVKPVIKPKAYNPSGYAVYDRPLEERFLQVLLSNTLGSTFYATAKDLLEQTEEVHREMLDKDPVFYAQAIAFARTDGWMRTQPIYGLSMLSVYNTKLFKAVFDRVIFTPGDLSDFMSISTSLRANNLGSAAGKGVSLPGRVEFPINDPKPFYAGRAVKETVAKWLSNNLSAYWMVKYGSDTTSRFSLKDMLKIFHPKGINEANGAWLLGKKILKKNSKKLDEIIVAFEGLKNATTIAEKVKYISAGKLPHEVASTFAGDSKAPWKAIGENMPNFALLKNLANLERKGVIDELRTVIESRFSNAAGIAKSKILPFRFYDAYQKVTRSWVKDSLRDGIENSIANIPAFDGRTAVLLDISDSMESFLRTASLFAVGATKLSKQGTLITFDTSAKRVEISKRDSVLTQAERIQTAGATDTSAPIKLLTSTGTVVDNIIMVTDEHQNTGSPMYAAFKHYQSHINQNVKLFIVDVANGSASVPNVKNVHYIFGFGDQVLNYISAVTYGFDNQVKNVKARIKLYESSK